VKNADFQPRIKHFAQKCPVTEENPVFFGVFLQKPIEIPYGSVYNDHIVSDGDRVPVSGQAFRLPAGCVLLF
jgi:hypothetical protein